MIRNVALAILLLQIAPQPAVVRKPSVEGIVVATGTNDPIQDVRVELTGFLNDSTRVGPLSFTTGKDGRFQLKDLDAGTYSITFACNGYVRRGLLESGSRINLAMNQEMKNIAVHMAATGSVSGHIRDRNGDPLVGVPVYLMQSVYDSAGHRMLQAFGTSDANQTDDHGEYRLFYITPGAYYLYAGNPYLSFPSHNGDTDDAAYHEAYSYAYYPGVTDSRQATTIMVESGSDIGGIDVALERPPVYRVRGRIIDSKSGKAPNDVQIRLNFNDPALGAQGNGQYMGGEVGKYENGIFEFRNVIPGSFVVSAVLHESSIRTAYVPITVGNRDVENLTIRIPVNASIHGRWTVDGRQPSEPRIAVRLTPESTVNAPGFYNWYDISLQADGNFDVQNVSPGEYRLSALYFPPGFYLKEARFGGTDVLDRPLRFNGNEDSSLNIVLGNNAGIVEGSATDSNLKPFPYAKVVLVPYRNRDRTDLFRSVDADEKGRFTISNVVPGDYRVFAWESNDAYAYFDPEVIRRAEPSGTPLSVSESARRAIAVKVQPASHAQ